MRNGASWKKKEKACTDEEKEDHGDQWDHVVMDAESKAVIIHGFVLWLSRRKEW